MPIRFRSMRVFAPAVLVLAFASGAVAQMGATPGGTTGVPSGMYVTPSSSTTAAPATSPAPAATTTTAPTTTAAPAQPAAPPPGYTTTTTTTTERTPSSDHQERKDHTRLRIGLEVGLGPILGKTKGLQIAVIGQLGVQFNDHWALYYAPSILIGGAGSNDDIRSFVSTGQLGYLALHPTQHLELDAGGGVAIGYDAQCTIGSPCSASSNNVDAVVSGRLAFNLGFKSVRARLGIPFAIQYYGTFLDNGNVSHALMFTIGFLRY